MWVGAQSRKSHGRKRLAVFSVFTTNPATMGLGERLSIWPDEHIPNIKNQTSKIGTQRPGRAMGNAEQGNERQGSRIRDQAAATSGRGRMGESAKQTQFRGQESWVSGQGPAVRNEANRAGGLMFEV